MKIMDAAHYLVYLSYHNERGSLTPLKLQKLLYLSQGWSYVWDDRPLFQEEFAAWQYGPVNPLVYSHFRIYGKKEIPASEGRLCKGHIDEKETLEAVWRNYFDWSASELVELTHNQKPWQEAYGIKEIIDNEDIREYFQSTY